MNAIEKCQSVLNAASDLRADWRDRYQQASEFLQPGDIVPTIISGGEWWVSYPAACRVVFDITYLARQADHDGWGTEVEREIEDRISALAAGDNWLADHPPVIEWGTDLPPAALLSNHPIASLSLAVGAALGRPGQPSATHSWHDPATFTRLGTPTIAHGPSSLSDSGSHLAHAIDEFVRVDELVACAQAYAVIAMRHNGVLRDKQPYPSKARAGSHSLFDIRL